MSDSQNSAANRKSRGYPISQDWEDGQCLGPQELSSLNDGDRVLVIWGGGNGPHEYSVKISEHGEILACVEGLPDGYPGTLFQLDVPNCRPLAWIERAS